MRGRRTWRRAARRRSARANAMLPRVASHDRLSPEWSANRAAACRAGKVEPQLAFLHIALLETLPSSLRVHGTLVNGHARSALYGSRFPPRCEPCSRWGHPSRLARAGRGVVRLPLFTETDFDLHQIPFGDCPFGKFPRELFRVFGLPCI